MPTPSADPIVQEKHRAQKAILDQAHGDLKKYNEIVRSEVQRIRDRHPGLFKVASRNSSLAA